MKRRTKLFVAGAVAGAGLLAVGSFVGHRSSEAFAREFDPMQFAANEEGVNEDGASEARDDGRRRHSGRHWRRHHGYHKGHGRHHRMRKMFRRLKKMDVDQNGEVTEAEFLKRRQDRFAWLDTDNNKSLSAGELARPIGERQQWRAKRKMKRLDADKDNRIAKDEMLAVAREKFARHDLDGDGKITKEDLPPHKHGKKWRKRGHKFGWWHGRGSLEKVEQYVEKRFTKLDENKDGFIDVGELTSRKADRLEFAKRKRLHVLDTNRDGSVSETEFMEKARKRFSLWDLDDSGAITAEDLPPRMALRWQEK